MDGGRGQSTVPLPKRTKRERTRASLEETPTDRPSAEVRRRQPQAENMSMVAEAVAARAATHRNIQNAAQGGESEFFEYRDHTADVQLHAWGENLQAAFEHIVPCMSNYMTDLCHVEVDDRCTQSFAVAGHDLESLLYNYLDEVLFRFNTEGFICKSVEILNFDQHAHRIVVRAQGDTFDLSKHSQGTEIKAITYSNMQIHDHGGGRADLYVIVDI